MLLLVFIIVGDKYGKPRDTFVNVLQVFLNLVSLFFYREQFKDRIDLIVVRLADGLFKV